jgi:hypothetical protein
LDILAVLAPVDLASIPPEDMQPYARHVFCNFKEPTSANGDAPIRLPGCKQVLGKEYLATAPEGTSRRSTEA